MPLQKILVGIGKRLCVVAGMVTIVAAAVLAEEQQATLKNDLFAAITLAGHHCGEVVEVATEGPRRYRATCKTGSKVRVVVTDDERLRIVDVTTGGTLSLPGPEPHESMVKRHLFSIINLSGHDCDEVVAIKRSTRLRYRVDCKNDSSFNISLAADGKVVVQALD